MLKEQLITKNIADAHSIVEGADAHSIVEGKTNKSKQAFGPNTRQGAQTIPPARTLHTCRHAGTGMLNIRVEPNPKPACPNLNVKSMHRYVLACPFRSLLEGTEELGLV